MSDEFYVVRYPDGTMLGYDDRGALATGYPCKFTNLNRVHYFDSPDKADAALRRAEELATDGVDLKGGVTVGACLIEYPTDPF